MAMDKATLHDAIRQAFDEVPYPGDECIGHPDGRDDGEIVAEGFRGVDWRSLKSNELWPPALGFMTDEAFHYYFPAYLLASNEEDSGDVIASVFHKLTPPKLRNWRYPGDEEAFQTQYRAFSAEQRNSICEYIVFVLKGLRVWQQESGESLKNDEAKIRALLEYWLGFK